MNGQLFGTLAINTRFTYYDTPEKVYTKVTATTATHGSKITHPGEGVLVFPVTEETWQKLHELGEYTIWKYRDVFNATKDGQPPKGHGGYLNLYTLLKVKGLRKP